VCGCCCQGLREGTERRREKDERNAAATFREESQSLPNPAAKGAFCEGCDLILIRVEEEDETIDAATAAFTEQQFREQRMGRREFEGREGKNSGL
jgi:hypothetical protein